MLSNEINMEGNLATALQKLSVSMYQAKGTDSCYFKIGCIKVRVSDHLSFNTDGDLAVFGNKRGSHYVYAIIPMVGTFKEVQWFYNTKDVIDFIITYEKMARLMIKLPLNYEPKSEESSKVDSHLDVSLAGKIDYLVWTKHLRFIYVCPTNPQLSKLADQIWTLDGTQSTFSAILKMGSLTTEERENQMNRIIRDLSQNKDNN